MELNNLIETEKVLGIVRTETRDQALSSAKAAIVGGMKLIEISLTVPEAYSVIGELSHNYPDVLIGAGTVINADMAEMAINAGAKWIVSPHTDPEIIRYCRHKKAYVSPGALTPNEIYNAWNLGADVVKVYPVSSVGGPKYIRTILEPLSFLKLMPTGTITSDNILEYLDAGVYAVGVGSAIFDKACIQAGRYHLITEKAQKLITIVQDWLQT